MKYMDLGGLSTGYGNFFGAANFTDADAGANNGGLFTANLESIIAENVVTNLYESIINLVNDENESEAYKVLKLRKEFLAFAASAHFKSLSELVKPIDTNDNTVTMLGFLRNLSRPDFNPSAKEHFRDLAIDLSGNVSDISGSKYDFSGAEVHLNLANARYLEILPQLFEVDAALRNALNNFKIVESRVDQFCNLEANTASSELYKSFATYLMVFFKDLNLVDKFNNFVRLHREFTALRTLLNLRSACTDEYQLPQCSICISNPITHTLIPCGHTFCNSCVFKQQTNCYICRTRMASRMKLFFS